MSSNFSLIHINPLRLIENSPQRNCIIRLGNIPKIRTKETSKEITNFDKEPTFKVSLPPLIGA